MQPWWQPWTLPIFAAVVGFLSWFIQRQFTQKSIREDQMRAQMQAIMEDVAELRHQIALLHQQLDPFLRVIEEHMSGLLRPPRGRGRAG
jgi:cell division protein FtsB